MAIEVLEDLCGALFWARMETPLGEFCGDIGADVAAVLDRIAAMPVPPADTDWNAGPIHRLVDYLTSQHADFREREMPAIESLLVAERLPAYPDGYVVRLLLQEFRHFQGDFLKHMDEEEEFLYPRILRAEAWGRHRELGPGDFRGSVNLYLKLETHRPEADFKRMILSIQEKLRYQHMRRPAAELASRAQDALDRFALRLAAHADLETHFLFPRAARMEQDLNSPAGPGPGL